MQKIFGYDWQDIQQAQQGGRLSRAVPAVNPEEYAKQIRADVERFHIPVSKIVADAYGIVLPIGYTLHGDTWLYTSAAD